MLGIAAAAVAAVTTAQAAKAQGAILVQGIADAELWKTDSAFILLTRNGGRPSFLGRVHLWGAAELSVRAQIAYLHGTERSAGS